MAAEPIEIIIRKGTGGTGTGFGIKGAEQSSSALQNEENNGLQDLYKQYKRIRNFSLVNFAIGAAKRELNYQISQYGNRTGNYIQQSDMQMLMQGFNDISSIIGTGFGAGMITSNAAIGIIAAAIQTANITIGYVNQYRTLQTNISKINTYANIMLDRSGNSLSNESRGTYQ